MEKKLDKLSPIGVGEPSIATSPARARSESTASCRCGTAGFRQAGESRYLQDSGLPQCVRGAISAQSLALLKNCGSAAEKKDFVVLNRELLSGEKAVPEHLRRRESSIARRHLRLVPFIGASSRNANGEKRRPGGTPARSRHALRAVKVAVIGAGMAGVSAASALRDAGVACVTLFEARSRIGGRCCSAKVNFLDGDHSRVMHRQRDTFEQRISAAAGSRGQSPVTHFKSTRNDLPLTAAQDHETPEGRQGRSIRASACKEGANSCHAEVPAASATKTSEADDLLCTQTRDEVLLSVCGEEKKTNLAGCTAQLSIEVLANASLPKTIEILPLCGRVDTMQEASLQTKGRPYASCASFHPPALCLPFQSRRPLVSTEEQIKSPPTPACSPARELSSPTAAVVLASSSLQPPRVTWSSSPLKPQSTLEGLATPRKEPGLQNGDVKEFFFDTHRRNAPAAEALRGGVAGNKDARFSTNTERRVQVDGIDLGASWIHGIDENPVYKVCLAKGLHPYGAAGGESFCCGRSCCANFAPKESSAATAAHTVGEAALLADEALFDEATGQLADAGLDAWAYQTHQRHQVEAEGDEEGSKPYGAEEGGGGGAKETKTSRLRTESAPSYHPGERGGGARGGRKRSNSGDGAEEGKEQVKRLRLARQRKLLWTSLGSGLNRRLREAVRGMKRRTQQEQQRIECSASHGSESKQSGEDEGEAAVYNYREGTVAQSRSAESVIERAGSSAEHTRTQRSREGISDRDVDKSGLLKPSLALRGNTQDEENGGAGGSKAEACGAGARSRPTLQKDGNASTRCTKGDAESSSANCNWARRAITRQKRRHADSLSAVTTPTQQEGGGKVEADGEQGDCVEGRLLMWHLSNLEYSAGADVEDLSMMCWDQDDLTAFQGQHVLIWEGYNAAVEVQARGLDIRLRQVVTGVQHSSTGVRLFFDHGRRCTELFDFCICTAPLGVLKASVDAYERKQLHANSHDTAHLQNKDEPHSGAMFSGLPFPGKSSCDVGSRDTTPEAADFCEATYVERNVVSASREEERGCSVAMVNTDSEEHREAGYSCGRQVQTDRRGAEKRAAGHAGAAPECGGFPSPKGAAKLAVARCTDTGEVLQFATEQSWSNDSHLQNGAVAALKSPVCKGPIVEQPRLPRVDKQSAASHPTSLISALPALPSSAAFATAAAIRRKTEMLPLSSPRSLAETEIPVLFRERSGSGAQPYASWCGRDLPDVISGASRMADKALTLLGRPVSACAADVFRATAAATTCSAAAVSPAAAASHFAAAGDRSFAAAGHSAAAAVSPDIAAADLRPDAVAADPLFPAAAGAVPCAVFERSGACDLHEKHTAVFIAGPTLNAAPVIPHCSSAVDVDSCLPGAEQGSWEEEEPPDSLHEVPVQFTIPERLRRYVKKIRKECSGMAAALCFTDNSAESDAAQDGAAAAATPGDGRMHASRSDFACGGRPLPASGGQRPVKRLCFSAVAEEEEGQEREQTNARRLRGREENVQSTWQVEERLESMSCERSFEAGPLISPFKRGACSRAECAGKSQQRPSACCRVRSITKRKQADEVLHEAERHTTDQVVATVAAAPAGAVAARLKACRAEDATAEERGGGGGENCQSEKSDKEEISRPLRLWRMLEKNRCSSTRGILHFDPPLPDWKRAAIKLVGMGNMNKIAFVFGRPFWLGASAVLESGRNTPSYPSDVKSAPGAAAAQKVAQRLAAAHAPTQKTEEKEEEEEEEAEIEQDPGSSTRLQARAKANIFSGVACLALHRSDKKDGGAAKRGAQDTCSEPPADCVGDRRRKSQSQGGGYTTNAGCVSRPRTSGEKHYVAIAAAAAVPRDVSSALVAGGDGREEKKGVSASVPTAHSSSGMFSTLSQRSCSSNMELLFCGNSCSSGAGSFSSARKTSSSMRIPAGGNYKPCCDPERRSETGRADKQMREERERERKEEQPKRRENEKAALPDCSSATRYAASSSINFTNGGRPTLHSSLTNTQAGDDAAGALYHTDQSQLVHAAAAGCCSRGSANSSAAEERLSVPAHGAQSINVLAESTTLSATCPPLLGKARTSAGLANNEATRLVNSSRVQAASGVGDSMLRTAESSTAADDCHAENTAAPTRSPPIPVGAAETGRIQDAGVVALAKLPAAASLPGRPPLSPLARRGSPASACTFRSPSAAPWRRDSIAVAANTSLALCHAGRGALVSAFPSSGSSTSSSSSTAPYLCRHTGAAGGDVFSLISPSPCRALAEPASTVQKRVAEAAGTCAAAGKAAAAVIERGRTAARGDCMPQPLSKSHRRQWSGAQQRLLQQEFCSCAAAQGEVGGSSKRLRRGGGRGAERGSGRAGLHRREMRAAAASNGSEDFVIREQQTAANVVTSDKGATHAAGATPDAGERAGEDDTGRGYPRCCCCCCFRRDSWQQAPRQRGWASQEKGRYAQIVYLHPKPVILVLMPGSFSFKSERRPKAELVEEALEVLAKIHGEIDPPLAAFVSRWGKDPFARGSYSYLPPGTTGRDYDILSYPVNDRLLFAGEHTMRPYPSTVHGACLSGKREAERIVEWVTGTLKRSSLFKWFHSEADDQWFPMGVDEMEAAGSYFEDFVEGPDSTERVEWFAGSVTCGFCGEPQTLERPFIGCVSIPLPLSETLFYRPRGKAAAAIHEGKCHDSSANGNSGSTKAPSSSGRSMCRTCPSSGSSHLSSSHNKRSSASNSSSSMATKDSASSSGVGCEEAVTRADTEVRSAEHYSAAAGLGPRSPQHEASRNDPSSRSFPPENVADMPRLRVAVHEDCSYHTPTVVSNNEGSRWFNIGRAVVRAAATLCACCNKPGASVPCAAPGCSKAAHVPCAKRMLHWPRYRMGRFAYPLYCNAHQSLLPPSVRRSPNGKGSRAAAVAAGASQKKVRTRPPAALEQLTCCYCGASYCGIDVKEGSEKTAETHVLLSPSGRSVTAAASRIEQGESSAVVASAARAAAAASGRRCPACLSRHRRKEKSAQKAIVKDSEAENRRKEEDMKEQKSVAAAAAASATLAAAAAAAASAVIALSACIRRDSTEALLSQFPAELSGQQSPLLPLLQQQQPQQPRNGLRQQQQRLHKQQRLQKEWRLTTDAQQESRRLAAVGDREKSGRVTQARSSGADYQCSSDRCRGEDNGRSSERKSGVDDRRDSNEMDLDKDDQLFLAALCRDPAWQRKDSFEDGSPHAEKYVDAASEEANTADVLAELINATIPLPLAKPVVVSVQRQAEKETPMQPPYTSETVQRGQQQQQRERRLHQRAVLASRQSGMLRQCLRSPKQHVGLLGRKLGAAGAASTDQERHACNDDDGNRQLQGTAAQRHSFVRQVQMVVEQLERITAAQKSCSDALFQQTLPHAASSVRLQ